MPDMYQEELYARLTAEARDRVHELRKQGERNPVVLDVAPDDVPGRQMLGELGWPNLTKGDRHPFLILPGARVADLLNRHISPGLGTKVTTAAIRPEGAFRVILVWQGRLEIYICVFEDNQPFLVTTILIDLRNHTLRLKMADDPEWTTAPFDW